MEEKKLRIDKQFKSCPACHYKEQFFEELSKEAIEAGSLNKRVYLIANKQGLTNPASFKLIPIGTKFPAYDIKVDVCPNCGCIYAVRLATGEAEKRMQLLDNQPRLILPHEFNDNGGRPDGIRP